MKLKKLLLAGGAAAIVTASTAYASILDRPFFQVLGVVIVWGADSVDGTVAPIASDFVLLTPASGAAGADLIGADGAAVITGTLDPVTSTGAGATAANPVSSAASGGAYSDANSSGVLDAGDTLTAFGVDATTDIDGLANEHNSSFYVASNAAFDIYAQSSNLNATGDFSGLTASAISYSMALTLSGTDGTLTFGGNAQSPVGGGTGPVAAINDLGDMTTATKVFDGGQRTAASAGGLVEQSVRFDNTYNLSVGGAGYDLSMGVGTISADVTYTIYVP
ncbi:MAG: hypothetical protein JKY25_13420 [Robiginitomaculum sp.]|nr:hypothetical protein [Robiginitomaculum sp.]